MRDINLRNLREALFWAGRIMSERKVERRLAAILAADVVGYSRLVGEDEEARSKG